MEAPRSIRRRRPLVDCSNTVSRSSSSVKYVIPSLTSTLKRKSDQTTLKERPNYVITSESASRIASQSLSTNIRPVTRRMSSVLSSPASVLSLPHISRSGFGNKEFGEPVSDYMVRRKRNEDALSSTAAAHLHLGLTLSSRKKTHQTNEKKLKPFKVPPKKRQRTVKQEKENSSDAATEEYIEQKKAYFAEIDAFEIPEEEESETSIIEDASNYIKKLKQKLNNGTMSEQSFYNLTDPNPLVTVETLEKVFMVKVMSRKNETGMLVCVLETFEDLRLDVLEANISCTDTFRFHAIGSSDVITQLLSHHHHYI